MENEPLYIVEDALQNKNELATASYKVDVQSNLRSNVIVTYAPNVPSGERKPVVVKLPANFVAQLATIPVEVQGCPIEVLIKLCHKIINNQGKSILEEEKKEVVVPSSLILPD